MACSPLSCWLHSLKPVRCRLPTQVATSRFPRTSAGSPYGLPRQSRLASYFPVGKLGSFDSHSSVFLPPSGAAPPPFSFGWPFLAPLGRFALSHTNEPTLTPLRSNMLSSPRPELI